MISGPGLRRLVLGLCLLQLFGGEAVADTDIKGGEIKAVFEQELFELAYTVFLANSNPKEALWVALKAVSARSSDHGWRKKAAQTAEWAGRPDLALEQWGFLAQQGDSAARQAALRVSRALNEYPVRKGLLEQELRQGSGTDRLLLKEYIEVVEGMGLPQEGYQLLASGSLQGNVEYQLTQQARLAELMGRPAEALTAWRLLAQQRPLTPDESLVVASIWYGLGGLEQSWQTLRKATATVPSSAVLFWRTYSDLAWARQELEEAAHASGLLIREGNAGEVDYQRLIQLYQEKEPGQAYTLANDAWKRFPGVNWWYVLADTGLRSGRSKELSQFIKKLQPKERRLLFDDARSWFFISQVYRQSNELMLSLIAARLSVKMAPDDGDIHAGYLWLLVDLKQVEELRPLVRDWEPRIMEIEQLREPLAAAMMLLGDPGRALRHYRALAPARQHDPAWLASYGDVLEQAGHPEAAWMTRRRAQIMVLQRMRSGMEPPDGVRRELLTQAQLTMHLMPGDGLSARIRRIAADNRDDFGRELIMGWAMATGQTDLARYWYWRNFAKATNRPEWARLGLALEDNDRSTIAELIEAHLERLPYRDAVEGAKRAGSTPTAETHAFERYQLNRQDHLLDNQVRELYAARPGYLRAALTLQDAKAVSWLQNRVSVSQPLTSRYSLRAEVTEREFRQNEDTALLAMPRRDVGGVLTLTRRHERGHLALSLGARDGGLNSFTVASLEGLWQPFRDITLAGKLDYNERADEGPELSVAGTRDRLRLLTTMTLTPKDTVSLDLVGARYHDQRRSYLGNSLSVDVDLRHQFTRAWPDYGMRLYGGYHSFRADGTISPEIVRQVAALPIPPGTSAPASLIMPKSFGQIGIGAFVGQTWKTAYTRDLKSFAEADVGWTTTSGWGFRYGFGLILPVFGFDQLRLEFVQSSGQFGNSDMSNTLELEYKYFF